MNHAPPFGPLRRAILLASLVSLAAVTHARAHAFIDHAEPAVGGTVRQPPAEVDVSFTEGLEAKYSRLQVFDASGKEVDRKDVHLDPKNPKRLVVSLPVALGAGTYKVVWRAVSVDTHVTNGDFTFRVEP